MTADQATPKTSCTLQPRELSDRLVAWKRLSERALCARRPTPSGMQLVFSAKEGAERELREPARLESDCCSFADWTVEQRDGALLLNVTAPPERVDALRVLLAAEL